MISYLLSILSLIKDSISPHIISKSENPQKSYSFICSSKISPYAGFKSHNFLIFRGNSTSNKLFIFLNNDFKSVCLK